MMIAFFNYYVPLVAGITCQSMSNAITTTKEHLGNVHLQVGNTMYWICKVLAALLSATAGLSHTPSEQMISLCTFPFMLWLVRTTSAYMHPCEGWNDWNKHEFITFSVALLLCIQLLESTLSSLLDVAMASAFCGSIRDKARGKDSEQTGKSKLAHLPNVLFGIAILLCLSHIADLPYLQWIDRFLESLSHLLDFQWSLPSFFSGNGQCIVENLLVPTNVIICIDTSSSMAPRIEDAIKSFNTEILAPQKQLYSNATDIDGKIPSEDLSLMTLIRFSGRDDIRIVFQDRRIQDVELLDPKAFRANGITALREAIIVADRLQLKYKNRKTLLFIITDGEDNDSSRESEATVREIFERYERSQQNPPTSTIAYFIGSNQDAVREGAKMGLNKGQTLTYSDDKLAQAMRGMADIISKSAGMRMSIPSITDSIRARAV
jgi:uncharacterized protein YegL